MGERGHHSRRAHAPTFRGRPPHEGGRQRVGRLPGRRLSAGLRAHRLARRVVVKIVSYVPPLMPVLMPSRIALGHVAIWETPLAVLIMVASIYGMARFAGRIYAASLVRGGPRLSWRVALRLR